MDVVISNDFAFMGKLYEKRNDDKSGGKGLSGLWFDVLRPPYNCGLWLNLFVFSILPATACHSLKLSLSSSTLHLINCEPRIHSVDKRPPCGISSANVCLFGTQKSFFEFGSKDELEMKSFERKFSINFSTANTFSWKFHTLWPPPQASWRIYYSSLL